MRAGDGGATSSAEWIGWVPTTSPVTGLSDSNVSCASSALRRLLGCLHV